MVNINVQITAKTEESNSVVKYIKSLLEYAERNEESGIVIKMDGKAVVLNNFDYDTFNACGADENIMTTEINGTCDNFNDDRACTIIQRMLDYAGTGHVLVTTKGMSNDYAYSNRDHKIRKAYIHADGHVSSTETIIKQNI